MAHDRRLAVSWSPGAWARPRPRAPELLLFVPGMSPATVVFIGLALDGARINATGPSVEHLRWDRRRAVEGQRMTVADVVAQVRDGRLEDSVREAVLVARKLMEAESSSC